MKLIPAIAEQVSRLFWRLLSVPIYLKIMGIGSLVALVFGGITLLQTQASMSSRLYQILEQSTLSTSRSLAGDLERPMITGDLFSSNQKLQRTLKMNPDIRYIVVRDQAGSVVAHTFKRAVPADILRVSPQSLSAEGEIQILSSREGLIVEATVPILKGYAGRLQLGVSDRMITQELSALTQSVLWSLALCVAIGAGLAVVLTYILTRPIHHLVQAANRIRHAEFETRAQVFSSDEIGHLAVAFNEMAESLQSYRREVQEKERTRISLIERIVEAQEEERQSISRELHDQLGHALLALLLTVQSECKYSNLPGNLCSAIENNIRAIIDDVRRLAWGMRPPILDDYGLDFALARYIKEVTDHFGLAIDYHYSTPPELERLPIGIEVALYRIAQEAITNVARHADASQASVVVLQRRDGTTLLVEDNGCGFDLDAVRKKGGLCLGLSGMEERVSLLGGDFAVESAPGKGATIRVKIPLG